MTHYLITGGLGFIGARMSRLILDEEPDARVTILDNFSVGNLDALHWSGQTGLSEPKGGQRLEVSNRLAVYRADIREEDGFAAALNDGVDVIFHLAANTGVQPSVDDPRYDMHANVLGVMNLLEAARKLERRPRIVFASSNAPLGEAPQPVDENSRCKPLSPYGASKLAGEAYMSAYYASYGVPTVALRFGNVYGPGSGHKTSVVAKFTRAAMKGDPLTIFGDGSQSRDFIYIDDLIAGIRAAGRVDGVEGEVFQISGGKETQIRTLVDAMLAVFETTGIPKPEVTYESPRLGDMPKNFANVSKARDQLGWQVQVGLEEGLERTIRWYLEEREAGRF